MNNLKVLIVTIATIFVCALSPCYGAPMEESGEKITMGYFPNITHVHALIAQNMSQDGDGWFEKYVPGVKIEWVAFNAGPSAMEALFAKSVDFTYVGPNPALNAYIRSDGSCVRIVSGAVRGGAALVVHSDSTLKEPSDFLGKKIATPQLGNTQDIACRNWFISKGINVTMGGGDLYVVPTPNASIFGLFIQKEIDAAWTVEPWVSRLELEAGGKIVYVEPPAQSLTTLLAVSEDYLARNPEHVSAIARGNAELNEWILSNPEEAQARVAKELSRQTKHEFPLALVQNAWPRLIFDAAISAEDFIISLNAAKTAGFVKGDPEIDGLVIIP